MKPGLHFAVLRQFLHGFALPNGCITLDVIANLGGQDEKAAIDPAAVAHRFFLEAVDLGAVEHQRAKAPRGLNGGNGGQPTMLLMKRQRRRDIDIAHTIAVCQAERLVIADIGQYALDAAANLGVLAGFDQRYGPGLAVLLMDLPST